MSLLIEAIISSGVAVGGRIFIGFAAKKIGEKFIPDRELYTTYKQLERKFKHSSDFGIYGNKNPENIEKFAQAIRDHVKDPNTKVIKGTFRGHNATHYYNPKTQINVLRNEHKEFWSNWKLDEERATILLKKGKL